MLGYVATRNFDPAAGSIRFGSRCGRFATMRPLALSG
jgi:hypothetical protein